MDVCPIETRDCRKPGKYSQEAREMLPGRPGNTFRKCKKNVTFELGDFECLPCLGLSDEAGETAEEQPIKIARELD